MEEKKEELGVSTQDEALFETLNKNKKKKRRKVFVTVALILALVAVGLFTAVTILRRRVQENFARAAADVQSYAASRGTVSTTVSGTGVLSAVDSEQITVPYGVELGEITAKSGDCVKAGNALATVQMASVMQVLSDTQKELAQLDNDINAAGYDTVSAYINAGVNGRVKRLWAQPGDNVVDCMTEHGALAVLSLDGRMAVEIDAEAPSGSAVTVRCGEKEYPGTVKSSVGGKTVVTLTDDGPELGDEATVVGENGEELGRGKIYVHSPLSVTGYAGTVSGVYVKENQQVGAWSTVCVLTNTGTSANYDALLQSRHETEERQRQLIEMLRTGAVTAPFDGTVSSIDYQEESSASTGGYTVTPTETAVLTMAPDDEVCVVLSVDESDILSLELGAQAEVTVASVGEETYKGTVTEVSRVADSSSGMTYYSATVTLPKTEQMLSGMTAEAEIRIHGVDNAILIPADALHQTRDTTFVYTSYDPETQQYGGMKEVTAGVSNSSYVEIISGLSEGETVYYVEKQNNDFFAMMMGGGMPQSGGNRPQSGGSRPQGGTPRNGRGG